MILGPAVTGGVGGDAAPEPSRGLVVGLEGDLPWAGMSLQDLLDCYRPDPGPTQAPDDEKRVEHPDRLVQGTDQGESDGPVLQPDQVRTPTRITDGGVEPFTSEGAVHVR